jgi:5-methylcytosine-specific restriction endonuclease McrA
MTGRVKRKAGLAEAAARAERAADAAASCALCGRALGTRVEWHHVIPKSEGGRETRAVHPICHRAIHATLTNAELARIGGIEAVREEPAMARFLAWIADKPADFHAPTRRRR